MTEQEEIREKLNELIGDALIAVGCGEGSCPHAEMRGLEAQEKCLDGILTYLHSQNVVIRGNSLGFSHPHLAAYFTVYPLVKDG